MHPVFFAESDAAVVAAWSLGAQAAIAAVVTIFIAYFQYKTKTAVDDASFNARLAASDAASKRQTADARVAEVVQVNKAQDAKLDGIASAVDAVHGLSNSGNLANLLLIAELRDWKAAQTKDPADAEAAKAARKLYEEQALKQAAVDGRGAK